MKIERYQKKVSWKLMCCTRCNRFRWCCQHHIDRRSTDRVVWICSNGNPAGIIYNDSCHSWVEEKIPEAKKEGYYTEIDGEYRPKKSKPQKWRMSYIKGTFIKKK